MSFRPFGVGFGIVLLGTLWTLCLFGCAASVRKHGIRSSVVYPLVGAVLTFGLMIWPREDCQNGLRHRGEDEETAVTDANATAGNTTAHTAATSAFGYGEEELIDWLAIPRAVFAISLLFLSLFAISRHFRAALFNRAPLPPAAVKWRHNR
ncbi:hypothetical protein niasHT_024036 [Heterodera trifolii]|uniref:Transmembrane protein n=1 Tax=Heterodera trifolii TaxID=157864 RepID=A0ABD2KPF5_9BILA